MNLEEVQGVLEQWKEFSSVLNRALAAHDLSKGEYLDASVLKKWSSSLPFVKDPRTTFCSANYGYGYRMWTDFVNISKGYALPLVVLFAPEVVDGFLKEQPWLRREFVRPKSHLSSEVLRVAFNNKVPSSQREKVFEFLRFRNERIRNPSRSRKVITLRMALLSEDVSMLKAFNKRGYDFESVVLDRGDQDDKDKVFLFRGASFFQAALDLSLDFEKLNEKNSLIDWPNLQASSKNFFWLIDQNWKETQQRISVLENHPCFKNESKEEWYRNTFPYLVENLRHSGRKNYDSALSFILSAMQSFPNHLNWKIAFHPELNNKLSFYEFFEKNGLEMIKNHVILLNEVKANAPSHFKPFRF